MASGTSLKMKFDTMSGSKTWTYNHSKANGSVTTTQVKALATAMIQNNEIYENPPIKLTKAWTVTTSESEFDLG